MPEKNNFTPEELKNSNRIFKSATPKFDLSWYIKWFGSIILLISVALRSSGLPMIDTNYAIMEMVLNWMGVLCWCIVGLIWKDRALILLNGVMGMMLFSGLLRMFLI